MSEHMTEDPGVGFAYFRWHILKFPKCLYPHHLCSWQGFWNKGYYK